MAFNPAVRYILLSIVLLSTNLFASTPDTVRQVSRSCIETAYDPVLAALDSMVSAMFFDTTGLYPYPPTSGFGYSNGSIAFTPDSVFRARMQSLDRRTPIGMVYNQDVRQYLEHYGGRRFQQMERMMGIGYHYFPLFEAALDKYNIPLELKYLAVVESALNPVATSRAGAKGLWQFMYHTGKMYGLQVNSVVDDRYDPIKATEAAAHHLSDLYNIFGDWSLALAAYNAGAGNVTRALRKAGGVKDYWVVRPFLPRETRGYVPAFIAVTYLMEYASEHGMVPERPTIFYQETDTVVVTDVITFSQISQLHGIPVKTLRLLNPSFVKDVIPAGKDKTYAISLPRSIVPLYIAMEDSLYRMKAKSVEVVERIAEVRSEEEVRKTHTVRSGENLGSIAAKYGVHVNQLKSWNNLKSTKIYPKQRLVVYRKAPVAIAKASPVTPLPDTGKTTHTVARGESVGLIASAYGISVDELKSWNKLSSDLIQPGQLLRVKPEEVPAEIKPAEVLVSNTVTSRSFTTYTVQSGDTLWSIAQRFSGVSAEDIRDANNIQAATRLKPGQVLKVPVKS